MKTLQVILFNLFFSFSLIVTGYSQTIIFNDTVSGTWSKANSPYIILGDITVPDGSTLTVEPGVEIRFTYGFGLTVEGNLLAVGNSNDKIIFTSADTSEVKSDSTLGWNGITILGENTDTSIIENCIVEFVYAKENDYGPFQAAINANNRHAIIIKCIIKKNIGYYGGGIYCEEADVSILNSVICDNSGEYGYGGIYIERSNVLIANNLILDNGIGIYIHGKNASSDTVRILNNTIIQNTPFSSYWNSNLVFILGGLVKMQNCIVWDNTNENMELIALYFQAYVLFENCIIKYGKLNIQSDDSKTIFNNVYEVNPHFVDFDNKNYQLTDSSYAINSGLNHSPEMLALMPNDMAGNPRIFDDDADVIDIGAYEFQENIIANRPPSTNNPGTQHILTSSSKEMTFSFSDVDETDTHTLSVSTNNPNISLGALSAQSNNAKYTIDPIPGWKGEADIILSVADNSGAQDIDTFKLIVSDSVNYNITDNTVWEADTVYITSSFKILNGATLEIREGTCVRFQGNYSIHVYGSLKAHGTAQNKIRFTPADTAGFAQEKHTGWSGISLRNEYDSSVFNNCIFEYVKKYSVFYISGHTTVDIVNCIFKDNLLLDGSYNHVIDVDNSSVFVGNSLFYDNKYDIIIKADNTDIKLYNNTFCNNDLYYRVIYLYYGNAEIKNSVFWNNSSVLEETEAVNNDNNNLEISNCLIEFGESSVRKSAPTAIINSIYGYYPQFADISANDYHLLSNSPGINSGINDPLLSKLGGVDLDGNDRIYSGIDTIPDIGAFEYQGDPVNRAPVLEIVEDRTTITGQPINVSVNFNDVDEGDTHTITVLSDDINVDIQNLSGDTTGSVYTLVPAPGYNDTALISVIVEDNGGLKDSIAYNLVVSPCACGSIYEDMVWDDDTINVICDIIVEEGATLTINPGVKVIFNGPYMLDVYGTLKANGAMGDTIRFILNDTITFNDTVYTNAWRGVKLKSVEGQDTSELKYCEIRNSQNRGLELGYYSKAIVSYCNIHHNLTDKNVSGAGIYVNGDFSTIENSFIHHNKNANSGGGMYIKNKESRIINNIISFNSARYGGGIHTSSYSDDGSIIEGNTIENNQTTYSSGGGIYSRANDTIKNNIIRNNISFQSGGGIYGYLQCQVINNIIEGNICENGYGGGIYLFAGVFNIINNLIINNYAGNGGAGVYLSSARGIFSNNTVCKNTTENKGNAIYLSGNSSPEIINNIIWWNSSPGSESQIHINDELLQPEISHCIIGGGKDSISYPTSLYYLENYSNNMDKNPYFVDFTNDDYNLTDSSICINAGIENTTGFVPELDIAGNDRIYNGAVEKIDIGAYEYRGEPVNRPPCISNVEDVLLFSSQIKQMKIEYTDADDGNTHTLTIESDDPNITIQNISGDTTNSTYEIVGSAGWQGIANIKLKVVDNGGLADSIDYTVTVNDTICGDIGDRIVWDKDTIVVSCNVTIPEHKTLIILPGTVVLFINSNSISVYGTLIAEGTEQDSIYFVHDTSSIYFRWGGIDFYRNSVENTSKLSYCNIQYSGNFQIEDKVIISNSSFDHCWGSNGGALHIINSSPLIENCVFTNNSASNTGGAIYCLDEDYRDILKTNPIIRENEFYFNNASFYGGAIYCRESDVRITGNIIHNNSANYYGGAIYMRECDDPVLNNNLIYKNSTSNGGAIYFYNTHGYLLNNTIIKNKSTVGGATYYSKYSRQKIYNSIIYYNEAQYAGNQIYLNDNSSDPNFYNCFIQYGMDSIKGDGSGNEYKGYFENILSADPLFADTINDNYQLSDSSFCINAGTMNISNTQLPAQDIAGNIRVFAGEPINIDVGAYEFQGNPVNRIPVLEDIEDQYTFISESRTVKVEFIDIDKTDTHTITIASDNVNVTVENQSGNVSGSTFDLVPATNWEGIAEIVVKVEDNSGKYAVDTFNFIVSEYFCGSITENTTWDDDTIKIACDVTVEEGATLTITPGTIVVFDDYASLNVRGRLLAVGEKEGRIKFTSSDTSAYPDESYIGWRGIRFYGPGSADTSKLVYCIIQYAKGKNQNYAADEYGGGLFFDNWAKARVASCIISNNSAVEKGGGIYCISGGSSYSSSDVRFENNIISNNSAGSGGGLFIGIGTHNPRMNYLVNNIICNNTASTGGGIYCDDIRSVNNVITNNEAYVGGGIHCNNGRIILINSILWGNVANAAFTSSDQISIHWSDDLNLYNNTIEGGLSGIDSESAVDNNEGLIETNPYFISPSQGAGINYNGLTANWQLQAKSPCIEKGTLSQSSYYFEYPQYDIIGNNRVLMDSIDIGAYEFINVPPIRTANIADQLFYVGQGNLSINCNVFSDENIGDSISYNIGDSDIPVWMNIHFLNDTINITGSPNNEDIGASSVIIIATDLFGEMTSDTFNISVIDSEPPVLQNNLADTSAVVNVLFTYVIPEDAFVDPDVNDELTYSALLDDGNSLPIWLSFNSISREFQGTPLPVDINVLSVVVYATDKSGKMASDTFRITITQDISSLDEIDGGEFSVYPIPAKEHLNIEFSKANTLNGTSIDLYDVNGRLINSKVYYLENVITIDVQNLKSGIYYLVIELNNSVKRYKIPICK